MKDPRFYSLFATDDSDGMATLMTCPAGWSCSRIGFDQVAGYGLADTVRVLVPDNEAALHQGLFDAYAAGEAWLGYLDNIMAPSLQLELVRLQEPPYSDLCWLTTKACAYEETLALIMSASDLPVRAPDVADMLRQWQLTVDEYKTIALWRLEHDASYADTALWWLREGDAVWSQWVSDAAAEAVRAALDAED